jgi:hypothetical protein
MIFILLSPHDGEVAPRGNFSEQVGGDNVPLLGLEASGGVSANTADNQVSRIGSQVGELGNEEVEQKLAILIGEAWSHASGGENGESEHIFIFHY